MTSGDLTDIAKLRLQERTSLFINSAGTQIQRRENCAATGVSTKRLYKVIANAIWDWHWLAHGILPNSSINGIGDLVWVPHRFGALGLVVPKITYRHVVLWHGHFANYLELFAGKTYSQHGFRGIRQERGERFLLFSQQTMDLERMKKQALTSDEWTYWRELIDCYAGQTTETLNACASCRNQTSTLHNLWIQYVVWKHNMSTVARTLRELAVAQRSPFIEERILHARFAIKQVAAKIEYYDNRQLYLARIKEASSFTEFAAAVPVTSEGLHWEASSEEALTKLIALAPTLEALHDLAEVLCNRLGLCSGGASGPVDMEDALGRLSTLQATADLRPSVWDPIWLRANAREAGARMASLFDDVFTAIGLQTGLQFAKLGDHYGEYLKAYPLPVEGFTSGF